MKIIRHTARDMRQAMRAVREQLGEDAVILSSRRTDEGVEITAAVDFEAGTLEAGGFSNLPAKPPVIDATLVTAPAAPPARLALPPARLASGAASGASSARLSSTSAASPARLSPAPAATTSSARTSLAPAATTSQDRLSSARAAIASPAGLSSGPLRSASGATHAQLASTGAHETVPERAATRTPAHLNPTVLALTTRRGGKADNGAAGADSAGTRQAATARQAAAPSQVATSQVATSQIAASQIAASQFDATSQEAAEDQFAEAPEQSAFESVLQQALAAYSAPVVDDDAWISEAAREAVAEHAAAPRAPVLAPAPEIEDEAYYEDSTDPVEEIREATLTPLASNEIKAAFAEFQTPTAPAPAASEAMGNELKTLRRMLETQLAHLAWNDLQRRAPVHTEILRELTEIGISQDLAEHLVRQLPEDTEVTFARRFTIAGLSQYLKVTGDRWLDEGGRVAFAGATGVGKTTTLAKIAVRWVLRHGPRDIALVAADSVRIGAQDQLRSLAQMLGVPVYTPENFESLPALLTRLNERLILIDTPGSSVRDPQLASRLAVLSNSASKLETALVLAASTQAGSIEETVKHFAPVNPSCCVLTKLDEAASIGGMLSILIRARLPISYMSEGQRVPEDLRPARALELVSAAVRLAKARGAAADEDLLRRRFGKNAHGIS